MGATDPSDNVCFFSFFKILGEKCLKITARCHSRGRAGWGRPAVAGSRSWRSSGPGHSDRPGSWTPGPWRTCPGSPVGEWGGWEVILATHGPLEHLQAPRGPWQPMTSPAAPGSSKTPRSELPSGPVVRTLSSHCQGPTFDLWSGSEDPTSWSISVAKKKKRDSQVILAARLLHLEVTPPDGSTLALLSLVLESPAQRTLPQGALEHQDGPASPHPVCFQNSTFLLLELSDGLMCVC